MITRPNQPGMPHKVTCTGCGKRPGPIWMVGYADGHLFLCSDCALQLTRKITEDLCELFTKGGRPGYSEDHGRSTLCADCSLQLARKHLQDLCELLTKAGRHG